MSPRRPTHSLLQQETNPTEERGPGSPSPSARLPRRFPETFTASPIQQRTDQETMADLNATLDFLDTAWMNGFTGAKDMQPETTAERSLPIDDINIVAPGLQRPRPASRTPSQQLLDEQGQAARAIVTTTKEFLPQRTFWPLHPSVEQTDEWWIQQIRHLYITIGDFADKYYCSTSVLYSKDPNEPAPLDTWTNANTSVQLRRYISMVAEPDPTDGDWEALIMDRAQRKYLIMGVLARVLEAHVWAQLLFGADKDQIVFLGEIEKMFADSEGGFIAQSEMMRNLHK